MTSDFLRILKERGFVHQIADEPGLTQQLKTPGQVAYIGFDATAPSLHVGSLVQIMMLRWWQKTGHRPLVLMGGGTTRIGDPSFKDTARPLLDDVQIARNIAGIQKVFSQFLHFSDQGNGAMMLNNDDWLSGLKYIEFLRDYGRHFSVNRMLSFDSVKLRLDREQSLSFLEFNYMILQGFDFLELFQRHQCILQMGGSDQWGNIINGVELIRRVKGTSAYGLTSPLIVNASGDKMGKTAQGAIWLNADMLSPYDYWQFWRNTEDRDVGRYLRLFTELPLDEVQRLESLQGSEINDAKKILADHVTILAHGEHSLGKIHKTAKQLFETGGNAGDLASLPKVELTRDELQQGVAIVTLLHQLQLCSSRSEARRLIEGNGVRLNHIPVRDVQSCIRLQDLDNQGVGLLSAGKKKHARILCID